MAHGQVVGSIAQYLSSLPLTKAQGSNQAFEYFNNYNYSQSDISRFLDDAATSHRNPFEIATLAIPFPRPIAKNDKAILKQLFKNSLDNANKIRKTFFDQRGHFKEGLRKNLTQLLSSIGYADEIIPNVLNTTNFHKQIFAGILMSCTSYAMNRAKLDPELSASFITNLDTSKYFFVNFDKPFILADLEKYTLEIIQESIVEMALSDQKESHHEKKKHSAIRTKLNAICASINPTYTKLFEHALVLVWAIDPQSAVISNLIDKAEKAPLSNKTIENFIYLCDTAHHISALLGNDHDITKEYIDLALSDSWQKPNNREEELSFLKELFDKVYPALPFENSQNPNRKLIPLNGIVGNYSSFTDLANLRKAAIDALPNDTEDQKILKYMCYRGLLRVESTAVNKAELDTLLALLKHENALTMGWLVEDYRSPAHKELINIANNAEPLTDNQINGLIFLSKPIIAGRIAVGMDSPIIQELIGYARDMSWKKPENEQQELNFYTSFFTQIYKELTKNITIENLKDAESNIGFKFEGLNSLQGIYLSPAAMRESRNAAIDQLTESTANEKHKKLLCYSKSFGYDPLNATALASLEVKQISYLLALANLNQVALFADTFNLVSSPQASAKQIASLLKANIQGSLSAEYLDQLTKKLESMKPLLENEIDVITYALDQQKELLNKIQNISPFMQGLIVRAAGALSNIDNSAQLRKIKADIAQKIIDAVELCNTPAEVKDLFEEYQFAKHGIANSPLKQLLVDTRKSSNISRFQDHFNGKTFETSGTDSSIIKAMKRRYTKLKNDKNAIVQGTSQAVDLNNYPRKAWYGSTTFMVAASAVAVLSAAAIAVTAGLGIIPIAFLVGMTLAVKAAVIAAGSLGAASASALLVTGAAKASSSTTSLCFGTANKAHVGLQQDENSALTVI